MQVFAVFSLRPGASIHEKAEEAFRGDYLFVDDSSCLVASHISTTQEVAAKLGIGQERDSQGEIWNGIVTTFGSYWGFHNANTWEWIRVKAQS